MNKLLASVMTNGTGTTGDSQRMAGVSAKPERPIDDKDSWFVGGTPYAVAGVWTGYVQIRAELGTDERREEGLENNHVEISWQTSRSKNVPV